MKKIIIITLVIIAAAFMAFSLTANERKVGYINTSELYNDFTLKKELEAKLKNVQNQRKTELDSLGLRIQMHASSKESNAETLEIMQREYMLKSRSYEEENERLFEEYSEQIWKQLNQYVQNYGKENGYSFIYGATGDGSMMYADEAYDLSKEISEYVNSQYMGIK